MPDPILYHDPASEPSRAVHWFALEAGLELEVEYVWLTRGEHRSPRLLRINPAHQVPALEHGDLCLSEAAAILLYLAEIGGCEARWVGGSPRERAATHRFLAWHHTNIRLRVTLDYLLPVLLIPAYTGAEPPPPGEVEQVTERAREVLMLLDIFLGERGAFLGGDEPSVADLFIAVDLFALDIDPAVAQLLDPVPRVGGWLERLRSRPACRAAHLQWNAVVPEVRRILASGDPGPRDPGWVAEVCLEAALRADGAHR